MLYCFRCSSWRRQLYPLLEAMHWNSHLQRNNIIWVKGWYKKGVLSLNWWNSLITSFGRLFIDSEGIKTLSSIAVSSFWRPSLCSNVSLEASRLPSLQTSSTFLHLVPCGSLFMREGGCPPWVACTPANSSRKADAEWKVHGDGFIPWDFVVKCYTLNVHSRVCRRRQESFALAITQPSHFFPWQLAMLVTSENRIQ